MEIFTTYQIAKALNADISTVIGWIDAGKLKAYKTPGGHRRVNGNDLLEFLKKYDMPVPEELNYKGNKRILIVDDEEEIRELITIVINKFFKNIEVEDAKDGVSAGVKIASFNPDLLILDIRLPGVNGFEILKNLKNCRDMKILVITAYPSKQNKEQAFRIGADDFLPKPFSISEIKEKIQQLLNVSSVKK